MFPLDFFFTLLKHCEKNTNFRQGQSQTLHLLPPFLGRANFLPWLSRQTSATHVQRNSVGFSLPLALGAPRCSGPSVVIHSGFQRKRWASKNLKMNTQEYANCLKISLVWLSCCMIVHLTVSSPHCDPVSCSFKHLSAFSRSVGESVINTEIFSPELSDIYAMN